MKSLAAIFDSDNKGSQYNKAGYTYLETLNHWLKIKYIKLCSWEYWPMWLVYFPASFYFMYLSIRARSFFFFSASNPSIETGGMFFESKWNIFKLLPKAYFPATILVNENDAVDLMLDNMKTAGISFPLIAKPDRGERGWCVKKIHSVNELAQYRQLMKVPFLLQSYIDYPVELSVFYYRHPDSNTGAVTSVTLKQLLTVTGNGYSTVEELIKQHDRAFLQYHNLKNSHAIDFDRILKMGEELVLVPYGNHVRGAMFVNYNHIIDEALVNVFDRISTQIEGFYFGRFDLRCTSIADLKKGKNISILELNGAGAEPAHIYDPGFSFFKAQSVITQHYKMMFDAAVANKNKGIPYMTLQSFFHTRTLEKAYKRRNSNHPSD